MLALALAKREEAHQQGDMSDEAWVLKALVVLVLERGQGRLAASEICDEIARLAGEAGAIEAGEAVISSSKAGKILRALQLTRPGGKHHSARRRHDLDPQAIRDRARAYGLTVDPVDGGTGALTHSR